MDLHLKDRSNSRHRSLPNLEVHRDSTRLARSGDLALATFDPGVDVVGVAKLILDVDLVGINANDGAFRLSVARLSDVGKYMEYTTYRIPDAFAQSRHRMS